MLEIDTVVDAREVERVTQYLAPRDGADEPAYGSFGRRYYPAALGGTWKDMSFAVLRSGAPAAVAVCGSDGGPICYYGLPMRIRFSEALGNRAFRAVLAQVLAHLSSMGGPNCGTDCIIDDGPPGGGASPLGRTLHAAGAVPRLKLHAKIDLNVPQESIGAGLRKSYRSLVNWGRRNITLTYVNAGNPDLSLFRAFQDFHRGVAGRVTRPQESWDIMFETVAHGCGELSLGHAADGNLISATLVIDGKTVSKYSSAVYDRDRFDKPIGHWPVFDAVLRAKARGRSCFHLGEIPTMGIASDKEVSIGKFKRGFTRRLDYRLVWDLPLNCKSGVR